MPFLPASPESVAAFLAIVAVVIVSFMWAAHRAGGGQLRFTLTTALVLGAWLGGGSALVASGRLPQLPWGGLPLFFGSVLLVSAGAALSPFGRRFAEQVPVGALVAFQAFRLPLELVLHAWAQQGTVPATMTWSGQNWDIVTGAAALLAAPFAGQSRGWAWAFNLLGAALLLNVVRVAVLSSPVPFGWGQQPPLVLAWHFPYALIGPVCVGGAIFGHLVLTRALLSRRA
jgi:hypothetical protein